jgi:integrase
MHLNPQQIEDAWIEKRLYPRGNVYWFRWSINGAQYRESTGHTDKAKAIVYARTLRYKEPIKDPNCLPELVKKYLAKKLADGLAESYVRFSMKQVLEAFAQAYPKLTCRDVTGSHIESYLAKLEVKESTREAYRFQFKKFFDWLIETSRLTQNPAGVVKFGRKSRAGILKRSTRKVWVRRPVINSLIDNCQSLELKYALYCGFHTGLRKEEVIMSRPEWFDFDTGEFGVLHITFADNWHPKDGTERTIPLSAEFRRFLEKEFLPQLKGPYMIQPQKVKGPNERYRCEFRTGFENFVKKQGVEVTFHDTRRSFASNLVSAGVSIYKVAKWLGDDVDVVQASYGHLDPTDTEIARVFSR